MTDKELLELAAKAAGMEIDWDGDKALTVQMFRGHLKNWLDWNPLEDDGDALRLAVKLRLRVCTPTSDDDCALASNGDVVAYSEDRLEEPDDQLMITDLYAATRRAIVRAAAKIGGDK